MAVHQADIDMLEMSGGRTGVSGVIEDTVRRGGFIGVWTVGLQVVLRASSATMMVSAGD